MQREPPNPSEKFADQYLECQEAFRYVLMASRDAGVTEDAFATMCSGLSRKLLRLKQLGNRIAEARGKNVDKD